MASNACEVPVVQTLMAVGNSLLGSSCPELSWPSRAKTGGKKAPSVRHRWPLCVWAAPAGSASALAN